MDKIAIRVNASKIWELLSSNTIWAYDDLSKETGLNDVELGAAIGWLACQNKIDCLKKRNKLFFFLSVNVFIG